VAKLALGSASGPTTSVTILSSVRSLPNTYAATAEPATVVQGSADAGATVTVTFAQPQSRVFPTRWALAVGSAQPIAFTLPANQTAATVQLSSQLTESLGGGSNALVVRGSNALVGSGGSLLVQATGQPTISLGQKAEATAEGYIVRSSISPGHTEIQNGYQISVSIAPIGQ
jgi:hypothetical protein